MVYQCHALPLDPDAIAHYSHQLGLSVADGVDALAQAIALHPMWQALPQGILVTRTQPAPSLGLIGIIPPKILEQIKVQQHSLNPTCRRLRYISYADATAACEQLTQNLLEVVGEKDLKSLKFCGIPRGGLIVLGMLAYTLGLSHEQMSPPYPPEVPLVLVDDCALSGSRFARSRSQYPQRDLIFAPLYSHPELRRSLTEAEPQVLHCISGQDLIDHGSTLLGQDYSAWQAQNRDRLTGDRYWLGLPDYLCFPWNEPDHSLWNPFADALEQSWHILPPTYCLKNRLGASLAVQPQPAFQGWLQPTPQTLFGKRDHQILIGNLATGETFGLSGKAADFWEALRTTKTLEEAIAVLSQNRSQESVRRELSALTEQLLNQQILQRS